MSTQRGDLANYADFRAKVLEHLKSIEGEDVTNFHLLVAGDKSIWQNKQVRVGVWKKVPLNNRKARLQEQGDYEEIEHFVQFCLRELDGEEFVTRYVMDVINTATGNGLKAQWTYTAGFVVPTQKEPRPKP